MIQQIYTGTVLATLNRVLGSLVACKLIKRDGNKNKLLRKVSESYKLFERTDQSVIKESDWLLILVWEARTFL